MVDFTNISSHETFPKTMPSQGDESTSSLLVDIKGYYFVIMTIVGLTANTLSFLIIVTRKLVSTSVGTYLACLSVFDSLSLIFRFLYQVSEHVLKVNFLLISNLSCKLFMFWFLTAGLVSNYIIVLVTAERCYVILSPYTLKTPGPKQALISVIVVFILIVTYNFHIFFTHEIVSVSIGSNNSIEFCDAMVKHAHYFTTVHPWVDQAIFAWIPSVSILTANVIIIMFLIRHTQSNTAQQINRKEQVKLTYMLLVVSFFFTATTLPSGLYYGFAPIYLYDGPSEALGPHNVTWTVLTCITHLNYSCNFFLYILSGRRFRQEAINFFRCGFVKEKVEQRMQNIARVSEETAWKMHNYFVIQCWSKETQLWIKNFSWPPLGRGVNFEHSTDIPPKNKAPSQHSFVNSQPASKLINLFQGAHKKFMDQSCVSFDQHWIFNILHGPRFQQEATCINFFWLDFQVEKFNHKMHFIVTKYDFIVQVYTALVT